MTTRSPLADRWLLVTLPSGIVVKALCSSAGATGGTLVLPTGAVRGSDVGPEGAPTPHELASRALFAARCNKPPERWYIVVDLPPGAACDYADASEGVPQHESYGQAIRRKDGTWAQQPRGNRPVLLAWRGAEK
jgi:hypothetical protein